MKIRLKNFQKPAGSYGSGTFDTTDMLKSSSENEKNISIVFIGSGPVAAQSLEFLMNNFHIEAVITKPQPNHHRNPFPVLELAEKLNLPTHTVSDKKEISKLAAIESFKSKVAILIDFGILVGLDFINSFPFGIVNSHFSLLPEWRGADPITFSILSGQKKTGVSIMQVDEGLDTGKILVQKSYPLSPNTTAEELTSELIILSNKLLIEYVPKYLDGTLKPRKQSHPERASNSRKITKQDGRISWNKKAEQIEREIRAFHQWPKSTTSIAGKEVIITQVKVVDATGKPGKYEIQGKNLIVYTRKKALSIMKLKPAGKKEMSIEAFLAGHKDSI